MRCVWWDMLPSIVGISLRLQFIIWCRSIYRDSNNFECRLHSKPQIKEPILFEHNQVLSSVLRHDIFKILLKLKLMQEYHFDIEPLCGFKSCYQLTNKKKKKSKKVAIISWERINLKKNYKKFKIWFSIWIAVPFTFDLYFIW